MMEHVQVGLHRVHGVVAYRGGDSVGAEDAVVGGLVETVEVVCSVREVYRSRGEVALKGGGVGFWSACVRDREGVEAREVWC